MQLLEHFKELTLHPKNAEELKGLILQLAVQGKLTKQWRMDNPDVEPASVLFEKIQKAKAELVNGGRIKKEKSLPEINEEEILSVLPNSWNWCKLIDLSIINGGFAFKSSAYNETGVRVIRISDFDESGFKNHKIVRHPYSPELEIFKLEEGNIIMAMTGGTVGKSLFVKCLDEVMVVNQRVATIKIIEPMFEGYVNCVLQTHLIQSIISEAKNSTNDNISMSDIKEFPIPLPPLEEQKAIVEVVNQLFAEVEQLEALTKERIQLKAVFVTSALNQLTQAAEQDTASQWAFLQQHFGTFFTEKENVKKLREGILQLAVQGKLTRDWRALRKAQGAPIESGSSLLEKIKTEKELLIKAGKVKKEKQLPEISEEEITYGLPEGWVWCRLKGLGTISGGGTPSKSKSIYWDGDIPWVSPKDMKSEYIETSQDMITLEAIENSSTKLISEGSLLIVGRSGILKRTIPISINKVECTVNQDMKVVSPFLTDMNIFIRLALKGMEKSLLKDYVKYGMTVHSLKYTEFELLPVPLPPLEEQKAIVEKTKSLLKLCDKLEQEIETHQTTQEEWMQSCLREVV